MEAVVMGAVVMEAVVVVMEAVVAVMEAVVVVIEAVVEAVTPMIPLVMVIVLIRDSWSRFRRGRTILVRCWIV